MSNHNPIRESCNEIKEAWTIFQGESRAIQEYFEHLSAHWMDARGRNFKSIYIDPQLERIASSNDLWAKLMTSADAIELAIEKCDHDLQRARDYEDASKSAAEHSTMCRLDAEDRTSSALEKTNAVAGQLEILLIAIESATRDPGW